MGVVRVTWPGIKFREHRLRGFCVAESQCSPFPIGFGGRPYNSAALPHALINGNRLLPSWMILVYPVPPAKSCSWSWVCIKISWQWTTTFGDMAIWKFCKFTYSHTLTTSPSDIAIAIVIGHASSDFISLVQCSYCSALDRQLLQVVVLESKLTYAKVNVGMSVGFRVGELELGQKWFSSHSARGSVALLYKRCDLNRKLEIFDPP